MLASNLLRRFPSLLVVAFVGCLVLPHALTAATTAPAAAAYPRQAEVETALRDRLAPHPRLFWSKAEEPALATRVAADPALAQPEVFLRREAEARLSDPAPARILEGPRLLGPAQLAMKRLVLHSYFWRRTGDVRFVTRVRADLQALLAFKDWNPGHFLDTAVIAHGVGLAYDWCYDAIPPDERAAVRAGLKAKAFEPTRKAPWWVRADNNWNQVCHAGLGVAALAIAEDEPVLAHWILARAVDSLPIVMRTYGPDGAYAEGPSYWSFGTTFNVYLLDAFQTALGTDFGLSATPGFMQTGDYFLHSTGPSGEYFTYSDCGPRDTPVPAAAWFAARTGRPALLANEWLWLRRLATAPAGGTGNTYAAEQTLFMIWAARLPAGTATPGDLHWSGRGTTPTAYHRSGWTQDATWIAIKGGTPRTNHGHMDVGSFALDALGVRWADDLGMQSYDGLEKAGIKLWQMGENSTRWSVFRLSAASHSVLTVDGQPQRLGGSAPIVSHTDSRTVLDTASAYTGQLATARRGVALLPDRSVLVQDEITGGTQPSATVRWAMLTRASVTANGSSATLRRDGQTLTLRVLAPAGVRVENYSTQPPSVHVTTNHGTTLVGFRVPVAAGARATLRVLLTPGTGAATAELPPAELGAW
jgi:hypothetical protein